MTPNGHNRIYITLADTTQAEANHYAARATLDMVF